MIVKAFARKPRKWDSCRSGQPGYSPSLFPSGVKLRVHLRAGALTSLEEPLAGRPRAAALPSPHTWAATGAATVSSTASTSSSSLTLSPTATPPVSSSALKLTPKSLRLIVPRAQKPVRVWP